VRPGETGQQVPRRFPVVLFQKTAAFPSNEIIQEIIGFQMGFPGSVLSSAFSDLLTHSLENLEPHSQTKFYDYH